LNNWWELTYDKKRKTKTSRLWAYWNV
jgi:hypothetical protein